MYNIYMYVMHPSTLVQSTLSRKLVKGTWQLTHTDTCRGHSVHTCMIVYNSMHAHIHNDKYTCSTINDNVP